MNPLVYLASPYTHPDAVVRKMRFRAACWAAAGLMGEPGVTVFSPIAHSHALAETADMPGDWAFWKAHDRRMIEAADSLVVLLLSGWRESVGVAEEIGIAGELGRTVFYLRCCERCLGKREQCDVLMVSKPLPIDDRWLCPRCERERAVPAVPGGLS